MSETIFNPSTIINDNNGQQFNNQCCNHVFQTDSFSLQSLFNQIGNDANTLLSTSSTQSDIFLSSNFIMIILSAYSKLFSFLCFALSFVWLVFLSVSLSLSLLWMCVCACDVSFSCVSRVSRLISSTLTIEEIVSIRSY